MNRFSSHKALKGVGVPVLVAAACAGGCHQNAPAPLPAVVTPPVAPRASKPTAVTPTVPSVPTPAPAMPPKKPSVKAAVVPPAPKAPSVARASTPSRTAPPHAAPVLHKPQVVAVHPPKKVKIAAAPSKKAKPAAAHPPKPQPLTVALTTDPNALFSAVRERVPGQTLGVIYVKDDKGKPVRLLELPETPGAAAPPVAAIAHDLQAALLQDAMLADHLTVTTQGDSAAIALSNAARPLLVIGQAAADEEGLTPLQAAQGVIQTLRETLGPQQRDLVVVPAVATPTAQMTVAQKQERAQELRKMGDDAYLGKDPQRAETCYQQAMTLAPDYPVPFLRLAGLFHEKKQDDQARAVLQQALQADSLSPRQKQILLARQASLKS